MASKGTLTFLSMFSRLGEPYSSFVRVKPYARKDCMNRTILWRAMLLFAATAMLSACGGGGGDSDGASTDTVGVGWVTINTPTTAATFTTDAEAITLAGEAFVSPDWFVCCPPAPGVTVTWHNAATDDRSTATSFTTVILLAFWLHEWNASISLTPGGNAITIEAADNSANLGRTRITVTRAP